MEWPAARICTASAGHCAVFSPIRKNVAFAPNWSKSFRMCGVVSGSGPSSMVSHTSLCVVQNRVKTGPKPCNEGIRVVRVRARWEKKSTQRPSRHPQSKIASVTKGAATIYQSVTVGRKDTGY